MTGRQLAAWIRGRGARMRGPAPSAPPLPDEGWRLTRWGWAADVILAVFLAGATVSTTSKQTVYDPRQVPAVPPMAPRPPIPPPDFPGFDIRESVTHAVPVPLWVLLLAALTALPLAFRRRYPMAAYGAVLAATLAFHLSRNIPETLNHADDPTVFTFVSCLIAAYSAALYNPHRRPAAASLLGGVVVFAIFRDLLVPSVTPRFVPFVLLVPIGLAANTVHTWRQRLRALHAEQEAATRLAVDLERARIARELHDVVTHNVSMMTVQAGAARTVLGSAPEQAREALLAVEAAGRAAMSELRHVMGLLAMTSDPADPGAVALAPQPGLGEVGELAERVRGTGVPVSLAISGSPVPLPAGVDLAAYRVAQEALTNTVKHAAGASVTICVDYLPGEVRIEVADTGGTASAPAAGGGGRGLLGLRERLAVYGGTLDAGRRVTGGYRVRAVIPLGEA